MVVHSPLAEDDSIAGSSFAVEECDTSGEQ